MRENPLLQVKNLEISFKRESDYVSVIHDVSFELNKNEILGIVGESGSGKSVSCLSIMGLLPKGISQIDSGQILFEGEEIDIGDKELLRRMRGKEISMIFQEPMSSLNPSMRCGSQVSEILLNHKLATPKTVKSIVLQLFDQVKLPDPELVYSKYPHEISGGQKQRVMIAMAIACKPKVLIADEPTTALDVTVQKEIIALLKDLQAQTGMSIIFITHDLALVSEIADQILVMYQGKIVEQGNARQIFLEPEHAYTKALIGSRPSLGIRLNRPPTISDFMGSTIPKDVITAEDRRNNHQEIYNQSPLLEVRDLEKTFFTKAGILKPRKAFKAVDGVSFKVYEGETLGLVGESGCGKSTLGNAILQLDKATAGSVWYKGMDITNLDANDMRKLRKDIQIIFQDPYSSLNPRIMVGAAITEAMKVHGLFSSSKARKETAVKILEQVGLEADHFNRYPHQFSGGQRQRIGIARTIAVQPKLIVCDESVSALDISVQAQVLNLLNELKEDFGFTYIFISHDLSVVKYMSDQLMVMNEGKIEELGDADEIYGNPRSNYTQKLIDAIPKGL
ncbi:MAG: ABC transporter ATP-binding protein [Flavobacteriaceae bacterium]|nr:ABC transporter ATP-binding protein [Flavobacteriaceae bacterium]